eukprot:544175-Hanusia_phi.AAC.4
MAWMCTGGIACLCSRYLGLGIDEDSDFNFELSKDPKENVKQYYKDVETQMEARKWAMDYNKSGAPKQANITFTAASFLILLLRSNSFLQW